MRSDKANIQNAKTVLHKLFSLGVRDFVVCPGGRNAPFVELLSVVKNSDVRVHFGFEERSAGFFGLGLAMRQKRPVAVFTTTGTAFVETAPSLLEAYYSGIPLIVVSSDRLEAQWDTGAPQTMIQKDFMIQHMGPSLNASFSMDDLKFPCHINCVFNEPLIDEELGDKFILNLDSNFTIDWTNTLQTDSQFFQTYPMKKNNLKFKKYSGLEVFDSSIEAKDGLKTLFIVSGLDTNSRALLGTLFRNLNSDIYFESTGEIEEVESLINSKNINFEKIVKNYNLVVRVGGIPAHRIWRDIENNKFKSLIHFSRLPFPGLSFGGVYHLSDFEQFLDDLNKRKLLRSALETKLSQDLNDEQLFYKAVKKISLDNKNVIFYLGNSTPIRMWDQDKSLRKNGVFANRGLNGIDGQLSTAVGLAADNQGDHLVAILGDLTTLYDLSAPWFWSQKKQVNNLTLIVVNNSGGQIFSKLFENKMFLNSHNLNFESWSKMWNLKYRKIIGSKNFDTDKVLPDGLQVVEFVPS